MFFVFSSWIINEFLILDEGYAYLINKLMCILHKINPCSTKLR